MIYILEFFKGASLALMFFSAFFFQFNSFTYFCLGIIPGLLLTLIFILLLKNYELKNHKN
ncbi:hypothetical protein DZC71_00535 [Campylobacter hepaticus]|uniref:Uncharacterized protein n=1 Tax=Campylobacter hepaticus TaxID=1813019 RepID=A0A424Z2D6_9BACT|nr:hypothetical protein [Campylobacter hepaticus]RQD69319.1 hypothetical protein DZC71_00535 [Campylobacter hepaticus]RQD88336.1 hypothetical protein DZD40_01865 [Campylobacter hepaticus]